MCWGRCEKVEDEGKGHKVRWFLDRCWREVIMKAVWLWESWGGH